MEKKHLIVTAVGINAVLLVFLVLTSLSREKEVEMPSSPALVHTENHYDPQELAPLYKGKESLTPQPEEKTFVKLEEPVNTEIQESKEVMHRLPKIEENIEKKHFVAAPVEEKKESKTKEIIVKRGDSLEVIAKRHQTTVATLKEINHLTSHFLREGQTLLVPQSSAPIARVTPDVKAVDEQIYIVKRGDNLWTIAMKHHLKVEDLLRLNHLTQEKAKKIRPGDKLKIR